MPTEYRYHRLAGILSLYIFLPRPVYYSVFNTYLTAQHHCQTKLSNENEEERKKISIPVQTTAVYIPRQHAGKHTIDSRQSAEIIANSDSVRIYTRKRARWQQPLNGYKLVNAFSLPLSLSLSLSLSLYTGN